MSHDEPTTQDSAQESVIAQALDASQTRRAFLRGVGRKAVYATPILLTLSATPALASSHSASCKPLAGSCGSNSDCCSNNCNVGVCV